MIHQCVVIFHPSWWEWALNYRASCHWWVTLGRYAALLLATFSLWFGIARRDVVGTDRGLIYAMVGVWVLLQEGDQIAIHAPFLVWRLPLELVLTASCLVAMRRYVRGEHR